MLPQALGLFAGAPWWAYLVAVLACLVVYICRSVLVYKLGSKALDKVVAEKVPDVMAAVTRHQAKPPTQPDSPAVSPPQP